MEQKKKEIAAMFSLLMKVLKKKERKVFCYIYMSSSVGSWKEAHLARSFIVILCGITTHFLFCFFRQFLFFSLTLYSLSLSLLSRCLFQITNHNNNRRQIATAQMIENVNDKKNLRCHKHHNYYNRLTIKMTTNLQQHKTNIYTKSSNQPLNF